MICSCWKSDERDFAIKPMNCPCHVQVFNQGLKSYRDLPLRLAEFGSCHRNEPSGSLHGIMRVRGFVQDDAHIFCTEEQIQPEVSAFIDFLHAVYDDFGFTEVIYRSVDATSAASRDRRRLGSGSEKALADALDAQNLPWEELPGEGAFYGPKIEFSLKDCIGRVWQLGTIQVDFSMPGTVGCAVRLRGWKPSGAGAVAPRCVGIFRAIYRNSHRALRGGFPQLAGSHTGGNAQYHR